MGRADRVQRPGEQRGGKGGRERRAATSHVTFQQAVAQTPEISGAWLAGLQALLEADRNRIQTAEPRNLRGSVNVERCLARKYPEQRQWDYAVGFQPTNLVEEVIYWIEVHPANEGEVRVVLEKLRALKTWLRTNAQKMNEMKRSFIWISSNRTSFTSRSSLAREMSRENLKQVGRAFTIPSTFAE